MSHQGQKITEGKIRSSGFWIIGAKRLIASEIHHCVTFDPGPPFSFLGVDTFGPWDVTASRKRGGLATSKRWAILFTCLVSRDIHIELVEELSTSCFIKLSQMKFGENGNVSIYPPSKFDESGCQMNPV